MLLEEEMRRVLAFCQWKALWWEARANRREDPSPELAEGLRSYCAEKASKERRMGAMLEAKWASIRERAQAVIQGGAIPLSSSAPAAERVEVEIEGGEEEEE